MKKLNFYTIEKFNGKEAEDEVALAKTYEGALALAFGGKEEDYFECHNLKETDFLYSVEHEGNYKMFGKLK